MSGCPTSLDLERAYASGDPELRSHADGCPSCGASWREIAELRGLARELGLRTASAAAPEILRARLTAGPMPRRAPARWPWAAAAMLAGALTFAMWSPGGQRPDEPIVRGSVRDLGGARTWSVGAQPDEIVRLTEGTIAVEVEHLGPGERFRVLTADGEVEVKGTAFEVTARDDRLIAVWVIRGVVEVRAAQGAVTLRAGERWLAPVPAEPETTPSPAPPIEAPRPVVRVPKPPRPTAAAPDGAVQADEARRAFEAGWSALDQGRFDDAILSFRAALEGTDEPALREDAAYHLAISLARASRSEEAVEALDRFLEQHPSSPRGPDVAAMLGWLLYDRGDDARAKLSFERAASGASKRASKSAKDGLEALRRRQR